MRRYHPIGIPTTESKPEETHLKDLKLFVVSHQKSEFGVGWMRFEADAAVPDLVRRVPHVPFEVTDLSSELALREILIPRNSPISGGPRRVHRRKRRAHRTARIYRPQTPSLFIEPNGRVLTGYTEVGGHSDLSFRFATIRQRSRLGIADRDAKCNPLAGIAFTSHKPGVFRLR